MDYSFINTVRNNNISRFSELYNNFGNDERSVGWTKNKQPLRFAQIMSYVPSDAKTLLDIGSGLGDLYGFISEDDVFRLIKYKGIDFMPDFVKEAAKNYPGGDFECIDFMESDINERYDVVVECGCFTNLDPKKDDESYEYIECFLKKALSVCTDSGVVIMHFLTDKVDYRTSELDFHIAPERILKIAYSHSRRVVLDNMVFPFEACLAVYKDDSFNTGNTVFNRIFNAE
ncbi:MAG: class I SAM-dependent methyltransferase [Saccharofermentans sp.]|nr:class I SAM-dependent methyltransferase [Saccharofermentans sp.]